MSGATYPLHQIPSWQSQGPLYLYHCNHNPLPRLRMCGATPHSYMAGRLIMPRGKSASPTTSLEQCPFSEVNSSLVRHDIPHILWNPQSSLLNSQQPATRLYSEPDKLTLPYASELQTVERNTQLHRRPILRIWK